MIPVSVDQSAFNPNAALPYGLTQAELATAMQDVYDYFYTVNESLEQAGFPRLEGEINRATLSALVTNLMIRALSRRAPTLVRNGTHNGHPAILPRGHYPNDEALGATEGIEVKSTGRRDFNLERHGPRGGHKCLVQYREPAGPEGSPVITNINIARVTDAEFEMHPRGRRGTPTATLTPLANQRLRDAWVYRLA